MCRTVTVEMLAKLVVSYNHHLCAVSTEEVPEMLNNLMSCLCSLHISVV